MPAYSSAFCSMAILMVTVTAPVLAEPENAQPRGYKTENIERNGVIVLASGDWHCIFGPDLEPSHSRPWLHQPGLLW